MVLVVGAMDGAMKDEGGLRSLVLSLITQSQVSITHIPQRLPDNSIQP